MKIKDIEPGELDARFESVEKFDDLYIDLPPNITLESIIQSKKYYIIGNKGTGKTALLLYLSNMLIKNDPSTICSTILFKTDFNNIERTRLDSFECNIIKILDIESEDITDIKDFCNIWLLTLFLRIVIDNFFSNYTIFENDTNWKAFESLVMRLSATADIGTVERMKLHATIPKTIVMDARMENIYISEEQIKYPSADDAIEIIHFNKAINVLSSIFMTLHRLQAPYYICIDELETAVSSKWFIRDLQMIHDWIDVVWQINTKIKQAQYDNMKIILSVRKEILRSIEKNLYGDELNKKTGSYGILIDWKSGYKIGIWTPLIRILLKKIAISAGAKEDEISTEMLSQWFPASIGTEHIEDFIFNRTWCKPRDIVRFLSLAVDKAYEETTFTQDLILRTLEQYSEDSKQEIVEEMSAFYEKKVIDFIFDSIEGFSNHFTAAEYAKHIHDKFEENAIPDNATSDELLAILFRYGIVGCSNSIWERTRWAFLGDNIEKENGGRFTVHLGLRPALKLEELEVDGINTYEIRGNILDCKITNIKKSFVWVTFEYNGIKCNGQIHVGQIEKNVYIDDLASKFQIGQTLKAYVQYYDKQYSKWQLSCIYPQAN